MGKQRIEEFVRFHNILTHMIIDYVPYYFALGQNGKDPLGFKWKQPSAHLTFEQAVKWMEHGHNIGIAGTPDDKLVIIDVDDENDIPVTDIKPTLTCRSRSRTGRHHYYFTDDSPTTVDEDGIVSPTAKINIPTENSGEVRSVWQYVVAPGSFVPCSDEQISLIPEEDRCNAGYYTIERAMMPQPITYLEIPDIYRKHVEIGNENTRQKIEERKLANQNKPVNSNKSALFDLEIEDVLGRLPARDRFPSLFHGSDTGANSSYENGLYHCWRHNVSHNALTALAVLAGKADCVDAGFPHVNSTAGASCVSDRDGEMIFALWKFAKENGMLPQDDPIPQVALKWFAIANGMCEEKDLVKGWQLPKEVFMQAKDLVRSVGIA